MSHVVAKQTGASTDLLAKCCCAMARPCGKVVQGGKICVGGTGGRHWPEEEAPFSYISGNGLTRYGVQRMPYGRMTTEKKHEVGYFYPMKDTMYTARVDDIYGDQAKVTIMFHGRAECLVPKMETYPLSSLLLVDEYTFLCGVPKMESTSVIPNISNTPPKKDSKKDSKKGLPARPIRGSQTTAIAVSTDVADVYAKLVELSSEYEQPVVLAMTHAPKPAGALRDFSSMDEIAKSFYTQGLMDEGNQGLSCGVEAVNNVGFKVDATTFIKKAAAGIDTGAFIVSEKRERRRKDDGDDYIDNTGGGNNIPSHQMYLTLETLVEEKGMQMDTTSWHDKIHEIGTPDFWVDHQWVIVQIPTCGGHWVSMEKIMYMDQPAVCLREGRGTVTYDFITSPGDGGMARLPAGVTGSAIGFRKAAAAGDKKRKR